MSFKTFGKAKKMFTRIAMMSIAGLLLFMMPIFSFAQDPGGGKTGTINDIDTSLTKVLDTVANAKDTTVKSASANINKLATAIQTIGNADGHNKIAVNI